jgi:hypothetical protein
MHPEWLRTRFLLLEQTWDRLLNTSKGIAGTARGLPMTVDQHEESNGTLGNLMPNIA